MKGGQKAWRVSFHVCILRLSYSTFLDSFLEVYFKGGHPLVLIGFKTQNPTLLGPNTRPKINSTLLCTIFTDIGLVFLRIKKL